LAFPRRRLESVATGAASVGRPLQRAAGARSASSSLPLVASRTPSQASLEAALAVAQRSLDSRTEESAAAPVAPAAPVQRAVVIDELSSETPSRSGGSSSAAPLPHTPAELEQLATKLWGRLRLQLRRELLADRERAGMLTDLR